MTRDIDEIYDNLKNIEKKICWNYWNMMDIVFHYIR